MANAKPTEPATRDSNDTEATPVQTTSASQSDRPAARTVRSGTAAVALVVGLVALTAGATENMLVRDIQRYCTACWRNARLDPGVWDDCTQEVCCRLLDDHSGQLELGKVLSDDTPERRELVRAIDMVRKRVQRTKKFVGFDDHMSVTSALAHDQRIELGELLESARLQVLSPRQDRIVELWTHGWTVPEIAQELGITAARVSDEKYKSFRKLERYLSERNDDLVGHGSDPGRTFLTA